MDWNQIRYEEFVKRASKWAKKRKYLRELDAMLGNYEVVVEALNFGAKVEHLDYGFIHKEPMGILAIDQKGAGAGVAQTRLYVYPDKSTSTLHVLTIGTKDTQGDDIKNCVSTIEGFLAKVQSD